MIGGAIRMVLHQDPRYFYQGTGTNESRTLHALSYPFACKGDKRAPEVLAGFECAPSGNRDTRTRYAYRPPAVLGIGRNARHDE